MTKITVTDATGTKTVDMTGDTLSLTSTGSATWTIEAEAGSQIQYTRHAHPIALTKQAEPDLWNVPQARSPLKWNPVWRVDGRDIPLILLSSTATAKVGSVLPILEQGSSGPVVAWKITPPEGVTSGAPFVKYVNAMLPPRRLLALPTAAVNQ